MAETEQEHKLSGDGLRRFPSHERLDSMFATVGGIMKAKGGKPKASVQEDMRAAEDKPLSSRMLVTSMLVLVFCLLMNQVGLFVPLVIMARNCALSKVPPSVQPKYPACSEQMLANEMTIIVTVKDTCSQLPGFLTGLERYAPPSVHLIYTYPNFKSCATIDLTPQASSPSP